MSSINISITTVHYNDLCENKTIYLSICVSICFQVTGFIQGEYQDIMAVFSEMLNFTLRQFKRFDGGWGSHNKQTGEWNGMISNLVRAQADMITTPLDLCCGRPKIVDYLWTLSEESKGFGIKRKWLYF